MKHAILLAAGLLLCGAAQACTCAMPLQPFRAVLQHQPILVEGTVVQALGPSTGANTAVLQVQRQFKGNTPAQIQIGETMCMRTVWAKDMKPGQTYIVSLTLDQKQLAMFERLHAQHEHRAPRALYALAPCAESALLREGDDLFNFVIRWNPAGERKLEKTFYAKYQDFVRKPGLQPAKPAF